VLQGEVFKEVKKLVRSAEQEKRSVDGLFSIDISFKDRQGRSVALEFDGPMHFTSNSPFRPLQPYIIRNQLMRAKGYVVVSVTLPQWKQAQDKQQYLRTVLAKAGVKLGLQRSRARGAVSVGKKTVRRDRKAGKKASQPAPSPFLSSV